MPRVSLPAAPEAGGEAGVAQRQLSGIEDLVAVQRRQCHLGGADQVEVVVRQPVDLLLGVGQHAGADQRPLTHEHRRDYRLEPELDQLCQRVLDQSELEQHEPTAQVGKARARKRRTAFHVDHCPGELEVVASGATRLPDLAQHRVNRGRRLKRSVGQPQQQLVELAAHRRLEVGQRAPARGQRRHRFTLIRGRRAAPALARAVLLGAQLLELGRQAAPAAVELQHAVDRVIGHVASPRQCATYGVGFASDQPDVEHASPRTLIELRNALTRSGSAGR